MTSCCFYRSVDISLFLWNIMASQTDLDLKKQNWPPRHFFFCFRGYYFLGNSFCLVIIAQGRPAAAATHFRH